MPDKEFKVYHSHKKSCKLITEKGEAAVFVGGKCVTDNPELIAYLDAQIAAKHPDVFVVVGEEATSENPNDLDSIRAAAAKKAVEDYKMSQEAAKQLPQAASPAAVVAVAKAASATGNQK